MIRVVPSDNPGDPLFMHVNGRGKRVPLTHTVFVGRLKTLLRQIGIDPTNYAGHSFRRGGATWAHSIGISDALIKYQGDWHSDAYRLYVVVTDGAKAIALGKMKAAVLRGALGQ
jgi:integrase